MKLLNPLVFAAFQVAVAGAPAFAQEVPASAGPARPPTICGQEQAPPTRMPPSGSPPVVYLLAPCFLQQGGSSVIDASTYLYYIQLRPSQPSISRWVPYDEAAEKTILDDFKRLWATNFLDDLSIEVTDYSFPNGVIGKLVTYHMEERQRVKVVQYLGTEKVEQTKIEEALKEKNVLIRMDSFLDPASIRRVEGIVRDLLAEKGYQFATVRHEIKQVGGGPKTVNLVFQINEGPKVKIRDVEFEGNQAFSDRRLNGKLKTNKGKGFLGFIGGGGVYQEAKFEEDADKVVEFYRDRGYITVQVGQPQLKYIEDSKDRKTRWIQMSVPITEGNRYRVGNFSFDGNTVVKPEALRSVFKLKTGDYYAEKRIRKGMEKARELYGTGGYFEFTGFPDLRPRDLAEQYAKDPQAVAQGAKPPDGPVRDKDGVPIVDVTMKMQEGKQYFVNRITFVGNTTTRDNVIRRELRLVEYGIFNTEALKYSVKRLNQLGYFKQLEQDAIQVEKTPNVDSRVDVTLKLEEQNRNQLTFGAGVSQFEGFFGQLSFQTANFLGRGETFTVSVMSGSRFKNYQVAFTEPFLFDRPITAGIDMYKRDINYIGSFTQESTGGNLIVGFPVGDFTRMFTSYSLENSRVKELNPFFNDPAILQRNPFLRDSLLIGQGGKRTISRVTPSLVHNTVDNPIFPNAGKRFTLALDFAGLGGNTSFYKPRAEMVWYLQHTRRTSFGFRAATEYISPYGSTKELPIFERLFLGGEYSVRGFDIRTIGPRDVGTDTSLGSFLVLGGNKSLLFNAEYLISIAGPVRLVLFYDAGQVQDRGRGFAWKEPVTRTRQVGTTLEPFLGDPVVSPLDSGLRYVTEEIGRASAFKTSTGAEVRFFMPVLNVPFRLIFAYNPNRAGVLDNNFQPQKEFTFRFAVGSTF